MHEPPLPRADTSWTRWPAFLTGALFVVLGARSVLGGYGFDDTLVVVYGDQVLAGRLPYRDYFTMYGPLPGVLSAAALFVGHGSGVAVRVLGLIAQAAIVSGVSALSLRRGPVAALLAGCASIWLLFHGDSPSSPFAWYSAAALVVWALVVSDGSRSRGRLLTAGLLVGLACGFRPDLGGLAVIVLAVWLPRSSWKAASIGLMVGVLPTIILALQAPSRFLYNVLLSRVGLDTQWGIAPGLTKAYAGLAVIVALGLLGCALLRRERRTWALALLALGLLAQVLQRRDPQHAVYALCMTLPLLLAELAPAARRLWPTRRGPDWLAAAVAVVITALALGAAGRLEVAASTVIGGDGRSIAMPAASGDDARRTVQALRRHAPPDARVFIGTDDLSRPAINEVWLYHVLPQSWATDRYYLELVPLVTQQRRANLIDDLRRSNLLLLMHDDPASRAVLFRATDPGDPSMDAYIRREFRPVETTPLGEVWVRSQPVGG